MFTYKEVGVIVVSDDGNGCPSVWNDVGVAPEVGVVLVWNYVGVASELGRLLGKNRLPSVSSFPRQKVGLQLCSGVVAFSLPLARSPFPNKQCFCPTILGFGQLRLPIRQSHNGKRALARASVACPQAANTRRRRLTLQREHLWSSPSPRPKITPST